MSTRRSPVPPQTLERITRTGKPLFSLGQVVATPGALALLEKHQVQPSTPLSLHLKGDWGMVDETDWVANDAAVLNGTRIVSAYAYGSDSDRLWIITEAASDVAGLNRQSTCLLLPEEY